MPASQVSLQSNVFLFPTCHVVSSPPVSTVSCSFFSNRKTLCFPTKLLFILKSTRDSSDSHLLTADESIGNEPPLRLRDSEPESMDDNLTETEIEIEIEIETLGNNSRRIRARIIIDANLEDVWNVLTDYEKLPDFIPGLAVSRLIEKRDNFARLFQLGEQDLPFGMKFKAKGMLDCYEKDLENLPFGQKRVIEFKMVEGDFQTFEGKWSIEQIINNRRHEDSLQSSATTAYQTTLLYVVDVKPKLWLPVRLVEGRLCREIKMNLLCIREEAEKAGRQPHVTVSA